VNVRRVFKGAGLVRLELAMVTINQFQGLKSRPRRHSGGRLGTGNITMNLIVTPNLHVWTSPDGGNRCRPSFDTWKGEKGSRYFVFLGYIYVALKRPGIPGLHR
jgi:hypothetical protein